MNARASRPGSRSRAIRAAAARLAEAERRFEQARGRAAAGDPDDREAAREALGEINAARAELERLDLSMRGSP
jgi:hypothetical protein